MKCIKCNSEIESDDNFCYNCGNWTPKGYSYLKENKDKILNGNVMKTENKLPTLFVLISLLICITVIILAIGYSVLAIRLDAYKNMGGYEDSIANYYYGFRVGTIVCESIVFFVNVIASIGLSVLTFINIYNIFAKKRRPNLNALFGNALTGLLYIVLVISHYIVINELASVSLGWGPILIIVALFILFAAFVAKQVADCALNTTKKNVVNASLSALSLLVLLLACVVTMNVQVSSANTPDASVNGYALLLYALEQYSSSGEAPEAFARYTIGFILSIFGAILFILKIFVMEKDKKNNVIDPILTLLGGTLYIVGSILFIVNDMSSEIAGQVIGFIILMVVGLALPVCKLLVDKKVSD